MIDRMVSESQFIALGAAREPQELMPQADAEKPGPRWSGQQRPDLLNHVRQGLGIAGAV